MTPCEMPTSRLAVELETARLRLGRGTACSPGDLSWPDAIREYMARHEVTTGWRVNVAVWPLEGGSRIYKIEPPVRHLPPAGYDMAMNVSIREDGGPDAPVTVETHAGGVLHGFVPGSPASVRVKGGHLFETFMYRGRDVTEVVPVSRTGG